MQFKLGKAKSQFIAILLLFIIAACGASEPERPGNVSEDAFWVSGAEGGAWVELGDVQPTKIYATVYHGNGDRWANGWFMFYSKKPYVPMGVDAEYIKKNANYADGASIQVTDFASGRALVYNLQK